LGLADTASGLAVYSLALLGWRWGGGRGTRIGRRACRAELRGSAPRRDGEHRPAGRAAGDAGSAGNPSQALGPNLSPIGPVFFLWTKARAREEVGWELGTDQAMTSLVYR
jgi:hypothetical protein